MTPLLATHIVSSLASLAWSGVTFFAPSNIKLNVSYALITLTTATGIYLIWTSPAHVVSGTISGVSYLAVAMGATYFAKRKLARVHDEG
jgi:hypothetical protein